LLFEVLAQVFLPNQVEVLRRRAVGDDRILFLSKSSYVDFDGYYKFRPNSEYVEIAYYPDMHGKLTKEYECSYRSDDLGFLSNAIPYRDATVLLMGDSFAQGQGGCEWMSRLSPSARARVYSAAVQGHGFAHWERIVADLSRLKQPDKVLVVFTTDDFYRSASQIGRSQTDCLDSVVQCSGHYWYPIGDAMEQTARTRLLRRRAPGFQDMSAAIKLKFPAAYGVLRMITGREGATSGNFSRSTRIISDFAEKFDLRLVWIRSRYAADAPREKAIEHFFSSKKLSLTNCLLPSDGYLTRDGHPNAKGYDVLRDCVDEVVGGW
jgi:hypothetical protein